MSVRKLTACLLASLVMLGGITKANAWDHEPVMVDPFEFEPDFQWFEPVTNMDLADMKPKKRAHTGWFGTYDRLNLHGSRPDTNNPQRLDTKLDSGWGHRYEVGYMVPGDETGWMFNWTDLGVSAGDRVGPVLFEEQDFFVLNDAIPIIGGMNMTGTNTLNRFEYDSYELNKTWRLEPYHYGGILEPLIGIRWMRLDDATRIEDYRAPLATDPATDLGDVNSEEAITENEMFGGQLGFRYTKFRNRFTFSSDVRFFGGASWQCSKYQESLRDLRLDTFAGNTTFTQVVSRLESVSTPIRSRNDESFVGFDVRTEMAYQFSRHVNVRAGVQLIDIATGVWRGGNGEGNLELGDRDQDLLMVGGTFGITLNR